VRAGAPQEGRRVVVPLLQVVQIVPRHTQHHRDHPSRQRVRQMRDHVERLTTRVPGQQIVRDLADGRP